MSAKCDFRLLDPFAMLGDPDPLFDDFRGFLRQFGFQASRPVRSAAAAPMVARSASQATVSPSVKLDSNVEGWRVVAEDGEFQAVAGSTVDGWAALGRGRDFSGQIGSSKCDWRVVTPAVDLQGRGVEEIQDMRANFLGGQLTFGSSKRDWRVGAGTTQIQAIAEVVEERFTIEGRGGGFGGGMSSSKCDWRLGLEDLWGQVALESDADGQEISLTGPMVDTTTTNEKGEWVLRTRGAQGTPLPEVVSSVVSSKADFRLRLTISVDGGPGVYVGGFGSAKCDFRFDSVEYMQPGGTFVPVVDGLETAPDLDKGSEPDTKPGT